jgi:hypothetical protein
MKVSRGNRSSLRVPMLLAAFAGLALSASGCIIDGSNNNTGCTPDLTISWRLLSTIDGAVLTCAEAGNADTVTAWIDGGGIGSVEQAFDTPCPAGASSGSFVVLLPSTGSYGVSLELTRVGDPVPLSETDVLIQPVDCSGLSATPRADLFVDF